MISTVHLDKPTSKYISYDWSGQGMQASCDRSSTTLYSVTGAGSNTCINGSEIVKDALHKGDHLHHLPYWYTLLEVENNPWNFNLAYSSLAPDYTNCDYTDSAEFRGDGRRVFSLETHDIPSSSSISAAERRKVNNISDTKAVAALRTSLMNVPIVFLERLQLFNSAKERAGDLMRIAHSIQDRDLKRFKRLKSARSRRAFAQKAASTHLEIIFGWLPIIDEIEGAMELATGEIRDFVIGRGRHTVSKSLPNEVTNEKVGVSLFKATTLKKSYVTYSARTNLRAEITSHFARNVQGGLGFNPVYTLYDLTPFSFLLGWFSNLNHYIEGLDPLMGARYVTGSRSERSKSQVNAETWMTTATSIDPELFRVHNISGSGKARGAREDFKRVVHEQIPNMEVEFYNNSSPYTVFAGASLYLQRRLKPLEKALNVKKFRYKSNKPITLPPITYKKVT